MLLVCHGSCSQYRAAALVLLRTINPQATCRCCPVRAVVGFHTCYLYLFQAQVPCLYSQVYRRMAYCTKGLSLL